MQLKWLEDFAALAQTRSFTRAAELCHVTHPAFGRRIKALEAWAGTPLVLDAEVRIVTRALADTVLLRERHEADFSLIYHHPALASDKLVPVARADAQGHSLHAFGDQAAPYLAYAHSLALGRLVEDHLSQNPHAPSLQRCVECDSADALYEYVLKGLGVAWLPWSMVHADCKAGRLAVAGDRRMEVRFDVRLYRCEWLSKSA